jgi:hypothetical protein
MVNLAAQLLTIAVDVAYLGSRSLGMMKRIFWDVLVIIVHTT